VFLTFVFNPRDLYYRGYLKKYINKKIYENNKNNNNNETVMLYKSL